MDRFNGPYLLVEKCWGNIEDVGEMVHSDDHVVYMCPCRCGSMIRLPVIEPDERGRNWGFSNDGNLPTLSPSVQHHGPCDSHYFIQRGMVVWV